MECCIISSANQYGWAPYYAYPPTYIVRPNIWYAPKWNAWYQGHPNYWDNFHDSILIGAGTTLVSIMTRIFIISTIVARVAVGIKASMGLVLLKPLELAILPEPLLLVFVPLEQPALVLVNLRPLAGRS